MHAAYQKHTPFYKLCFERLEVCVRAHKLRHQKMKRKKGQKMRMGALLVFQCQNGEQFDIVCGGWFVLGLLYYKPLATYTQFLNNWHVGSTYTGYTHFISIMRSYNILKKQNLLLTSVTLDTKHSSIQQTVQMLYCSNKYNIYYKCFYINILLNIV